MNITFLPFSSLKFKLQDIHLEESDNLKILPTP